MTPAQVMTALGIKQYKMNPERPPLAERLPAAEKYGIIPSGELVDWDIGPHCTDTSCRIPYGVFVGNSDTPVNVLVYLSQGQVAEIDVSFSTIYWNEMLPIWTQKFGTRWDTERDPNMVITDVATKKSTVKTRITLTHRTGGINAKTGDHCQIMATNLDIIFQHHDPHGPFQAVFMIKLVSKNF